MINELYKIENGVKYIHVYNIKEFRKEILHLTETCMCTQCFRRAFMIHEIRVANIRKQDEWYALRCKECGGDLVSVDELFLPIIILLNKKGYKTLFCCSGHIGKQEHLASSSYIVFDMQDKERPFTTLPAEYFLHISSDGYVVITRLLDSLSENDYAMLLENTMNVLKWAESLPVTK